MESKPHVLLVAYINSHLPELLRVAKAIQKSGRFDATLLFEAKYDHLDNKWLQHFNQENIRVIDHNGDPLRTTTAGIMVDRSRLSIASLKSFIARWARNSRIIKRAADNVYRTISSLLSPWTINSRLRRARRILLDLHVSLVVLCEDNAAYATGVWTVSGHQLGIPSIVIPYTIANATEAAEHAYDQRRQWIRTPLQRIIAHRYPHWAYRYKNRDLLLLSPFEIMAQEKHHLAPPDPWMINSGFADAIAAESPFMVRYYRDNKLPPNKIILTGTFTDDVLVAETAERANRRAMLDQQYELDPRLPILLCAFPPPWFPRQSCDFSTYHQLIDFWFDALRGVPKYNILINLHPGINNLDREYIAKKGLAVSSWDVSRLIPLVDLYVANISATIRWAIACGLPVLNYDVYKYRFHDYDTAPGVITVESQNEFLGQLAKLTNDKQYYQQIKDQQITVKADWGMMDGQSGQRMIQLFNRLIAQNPQSHV